MTSKSTDKRQMSAENLTKETIKGPPTWSKSEVQDKRREGHEAKKAGTKGAEDEQI